MARGLIRKPSFNKIVGAYRAQWKRFWRRLFSFGIYGSRGIGWWKDPKKAWYNFWYYRSSVSVYKLLGCKPSRGACFFAMVLASVFSIFAAPFDATRAGVVAHKIKKARKARASGQAYRSDNSAKARKAEENASAAKKKRASAVKSPDLLSKKKEKKKAETGATAPALKVTKEKEQKTTSQEQKYETQKPKAQVLNREEPRVVKPKEEVPKTPDENTPKSVPKHESDRYVRKRMFIAGASYCERSALDALRIGTYFDLELEANNTHGEDAVKLTYNGQGIGYIAKRDKLAFVASLKLGRRMYGVITDIKTDEIPEKYEFEAWFDNCKQSDEA